jgi:Na+-translocating ferredoxin:NAD+ oxidoreductase subunit B
MTGSIDKLDAVLPQTQCQLCEYDGCRPYAEAIIHEGAPLNKCLPGGIPVMEQLGELMQQDISTHIEELRNKTKEPTRVVIDEATCIGCTKCIDACPTDAILGAGKKMHTVITDACTGCELCLPPCPVDCIDIVPTQPITQEQSDDWRQRHEQKKDRVQRLKIQAEVKYQNKLKTGTREQSIADRKDAMAAALARIQKKKEQP